MKFNRSIVPLVAVLFLASCNSASGGGNKEKTTSTEPTSKTYQPIPSYPDLPSYGDYSGSKGIAPNHISSISMSPNKEIYARVGDIIPIDGSVSNGYNDDEKKITFSVDKSSHLLLTTNANNQDATLKCLAAGDATLTAKSYEARYSRSLLVHILPNDGTYDLYETALSTDKEKAKFGYGSTSYMANGVSNGVSQFGHHSWKWHRNNPKTISTESGALSFGSASAPEGAWTFSTVFEKPVKKVILGISTARFENQENDYKFGGSKLTSWLGDDSLKRIVDGKTYNPGEECYTLRGTEDNSVLPHTIICDDKSGDFGFSLSASGGYIRLKYIVVEYATYTPAGTLSEASFNFDDESFTDTLTSSFTSKTVSDSSSLVNIALTKVKTGDDSTSNHPMIDRNSTITVTPKNAQQTISKIEFVTSPFISEGSPVENIVTVRESYLGTDYMRDYGTERGETINLERLSYGCNVVELKNSSAKAGTYLGIISLKVTLTDAVTPAVVDEVYFAGPANKMNYSDGDVFDPTGGAVIVSFTDPKFMEIEINNFVTWSILHEGDTSAIGNSPFGQVEVTNITTSAYVNKTWSKATAGAAGNFLAVSRASHTLFDASSSTSEMQSGTSNRDISDYFENDQIHGDYTLDHSNIVLVSATGGKYKVMNASQSHYFNGVSSTTGKLSFSASSNKNHSFVIVDGELQLYFESSSIKYTFCLARSIDGESTFFSFVDMSTSPDRVVEHVDFYIAD